MRCDELENSSAMSNARISLFLNLRTAARPIHNLTSTLLGNLGEPVQYRSPKIEIEVTTEFSYADDGSHSRFPLRELPAKA